jgi:hypothetical protein
MRTEHWVARKLQYRPKTGSNRNRLVTVVIDEVNNKHLSVLVQINGSAEIQIGKDGEYLRWTKLSELVLSIDSITNRATFTSLLRDFVLVVDYKGNDENSFMHNFRIDSFSGNILCCFLSAPTIHNEVKLKSNPIVQIEPVVETFDLDPVRKKAKQVDKTEHAILVGIKPKVVKRLPKNEKSSTSRSDTALGVKSGNRGIGGKSRGGHPNVEVKS